GRGDLTSDEGNCFTQIQIRSQIGNDLAQRIQPLFGATLIEVRLALVQQYGAYAPQLLRLPRALDHQAVSTGVAVGHRMLPSSRRGASLREDVDGDRWDGVGDQADLGLRPCFGESRAEVVR